MITKFKIRMLILDLIQRVALALGAYVRPSRVREINFVAAFLTPKDCGIPMLMIGDGTDGTYIVPDDLNDISKCFSPGVGPSSQFEEAIYDRHGIRSFLIDASVLRVPSSRDDFYVFEQKFLGATTYDNFIDLSTWVTTYASKEPMEELLLQMDIEGGEYAALLACPIEVLTRFRIIALEIHFLDALNLEFFSSLVEQTFRKLDANFQVCYAHANDCCGSIRVGSATFPRVIEITLIRKDRIRDSIKVQKENYVIKNM